MRRLLKHLKPKQLEMLVYLWVSTDRYYLCYPTVDEIASELGLENTSRVKKTIRELETASLVQTRTSQGRMYFLVLDPRHALKKLHHDGELGGDELDEINELLEKLKHPPLDSHKK
jgi:DNA-binding MarR family transcriptional regulator